MNLLRVQSDSPYKGGTFYFKLALPEDFPFKPPAVRYSLYGCMRLFTKVSGNLHYKDLPSRDQRRRQYMRTHFERSGVFIHYSGRTSMRPDKITR
jgi:hypothetical protein